MATSTHQRISWDNDFTVYWGQLYSLYCPAIHWGSQFCDYGYNGYPDPEFNESGDKVLSDLVAFSSRGDVQHILIECFDELKDSNGNYLDGNDEQVRSRLESRAEIRSLPDEAIAETIRDRGHEDFSVEVVEVVLLVPEALYESYETLLKECVDDLDLIIWTIKPNGSSIIKKQEGSHTSDQLDIVIEDGLEAYPNSDDLLQFSRKTEVSHLKFAFVKRLLNYCSRNNKREFSFDEVDRVMVDEDPPILGHLKKETREEEFWKQFLHSLLTRFELLEQSDSGVNTYQWRRKNLGEPRYRQKILNGVKSELGIGDSS